MPSIFNEQNIQCLSDYYLVISQNQTVRSLSPALSNIFGAAKDERLDTLFSFTDQSQSTIPEIKNVLSSEIGITAFHIKTQLTASVITINMTENRKGLIFNFDRISRDKINRSQESHTKYWKILYNLSATLNLQLNRDGATETIGRFLLRENDFASFHWHTKGDSKFDPSRNWAFKKGDPAPEITKLINNQQLPLASLFADNLDHGKAFVINLPDSYLPYKRTLCLPIQCEGQLSLVLQFFLLGHDRETTENLQEFGNTVSAEIERQLEFIVSQERERDQVVQLAQASRLSSLGAMAGGIAHEINNPLTIIMGMLKMTIKELGLAEKPVDREKLSGILEKARQYTERISKIVKGIRALSRDGSRDPFILSKVQDIVDSTFALCEASIKTNSIQLSYDLEDPDQMIQCRPVQISQVILNLINNSMDAIGDQNGPWIHVAVRKTSDVEIEFSVTDSGAGIPEHIAIRLMQPFFTTKGAGKGTGLGLSISQEIVKAHSGKFALDKDFPNTRFVITLPIEQVATLPEVS